MTLPNASKIFDRAKSHTFEEQPVRLCTLAELQAYSERCADYAIRCERAGMDAKTTVVEHCQIVDLLLGGWARWSLLRAEFGIETVLQHETIAEVHQICDDLLAKHHAR